MAKAAFNIASRIIRNYIFNSKSGKIAILSTTQKFEATNTILDKDANDQQFACRIHKAEYKWKWPKKVLSIMIVSLLSSDTVRNDL